MRLYSFGSGSSGNAFLLTTDTTAVLLDAGVGARTCLARLRGLLGERPLDAVIISHEHVDHVRALTPLLRRRATHVVATSGTRGAIRHEGSWTRARCGGRFATGDIEVEFVAVSHDAAEPCGFMANADGRRVAIFTDLGYAGPDVLAAVTSADTVVFEANYDREMLRRGGYPARLKRRIQGPTGHLSNDDCASALVGALDARARGVWLAHLSHNNNAPDIAITTVRDALRLVGSSVPVRALPRYDLTEITADVTTQLAMTM